VPPSSVDGTFFDSAEQFSANRVTRGIIFDVPPDLVEETLQELDFREKGGYARDVCDVMEEESQKMHKALLYRGTPDNPAFSSRAIFDLSLSAAIMSVAIGPSGANDVYLSNLEKFLTKTQSPATRNDDTNTLAEMVRIFQKQYRLYFLSGGGSNQHNQLLLNRPNIDSILDDEDALVRKDIVLPTFLCAKGDPQQLHFSTESNPKAVYAGGGHSGFLSKNGRLFLWGWNKDLQCGTQGNTHSVHAHAQPLPFIKELENIDVEKAALGFSHTLVVEKQTGKLFAFGNDERGQVTGRRKVPICDIATPPLTPKFLKNEKIDVVRAGLFHSAVVTECGELITFGCNRFGQSNLPNEERNLQKPSNLSHFAYRRWKPSHADRVIDVACGRRHTIAVDSLNRIWTFGENKHGQLGRPTKGQNDTTPSIVNMRGKIGEDDTVSVFCGWSHTLIHIRGKEGNRLFGFGRNDKGQLGTGNDMQVNPPIEIFSDKEIKCVECGSESTMIIDSKDQLWGCGWNEHGNLGTVDQEDSLTLAMTKGVKARIPPGIKNSELALAVGGAHYIIAAVESEF
jgi:alpha-tubulin suppressor-like RCC1 family protein